MQNNTKDLKDYFCSLITLSGYSVDLWTPNHNEILTEFLVQKTRRKLILFIQNDNLCLQPTFPESNISELMYFILNNEIYNLQDFKHKLQYGTIEGTLLESFLRIMQGVYVPSLLENSEWPEAVRKEFIGHVHKFMAVLTVKNNELII